MEPAIFTYPALAAVLVLITVSVMRGWFVPIRTHERELAAEKQRGDDWKAVAGERATTNAALLVQNTALLEGSRTMEALLKSAGPNLEKVQPTGGS